MTREWSERSGAEVVRYPRVSTISPPPTIGGAQAAAMFDIFLDGGVSMVTNTLKAIFGLGAVNYAGGVAGS